MIQDLKHRARVAGVLILVAYSMLGGEFTQSRLLTALLDVVSGLAVIGIASLFYPLVRSHDVALSKGYLVMKVIEGVLMIVAGSTVVAGSLAEWRSWLYAFPQAYTFMLSALIFYILLLRSGIVPRFISIWGIVAILALLIVNGARLLHVTHPALDASMLLIVTNEVFLAVWLLTRGFVPSARDRS